MFNQDLYNNIKKEPFKIPEDDGNDLMHTFFNPVKEGWLCKQGILHSSYVRSCVFIAELQRQRCGSVELY